MRKGIDVQEPTIAHYGMKQLYVSDPDGYLLCFQWQSRGSRAMKVHHLTPILNVSDIRQSFVWFEKLGWQKAWDWGTPPTFGGVCCDDSEIFLCEGGQGGRGRTGLPMTFGPGSDEAAEKGVWISMWVDDVDAVHRRCVEQGIEITWPPTNMAWNTREMHVRHPDGHVLQSQPGPRARRIARPEFREDDDMHFARLFAAAGLAALGVAFVSPSVGQERPRVERFTIDVPAAVLSDLDERLARTRWPDQLPGTDWSYGADTAYLRELVAYWQREYDWRAQERALNRFEHYRATVDGTRIHFVHARSRDPNAIPVLLLHGWPSTFLQMLDVIPLLTDPAAHGMPNAPSFHVVAASLPGFGFSDIPTRPGVGFATSAELMAKAHA